MLTLTQLVQTCNQLYPDCPDASLNGLQLEGQSHVARIATAVSADSRTIQAAIQAGCQALIVHHGLFWDRSPIRIVGPMAKRVRLLMEAQLSLLAYHLPMDLHPQIGNNWKAARDLGLAQLEPFGSSQGLRIGVVGEMAAASPTHLLECLQGYYGNVPRHAPAQIERITRVAILSGGGHRWLEEAAEAGCQALITGTVDEPQWHQARELGVHLFALGHAATERVGPRALARWLSEQTPCEAIFIEDDNPF
jgi:dinuclear metal center YbgI/SA1388 family protein